MIDFDLELPDGELRDNLYYDTAGSSGHGTIRQKRQVTVPPGDPDPTAVPADKSALNKNPSISNPKKVFSESSKASALPTAPPIVGDNGAGQPGSVPPSRSPSTIINTSEPIDIPFSEEDVLFDGNSSYPHLPKDNVFYGKEENRTIKEVDKFKYYSVVSDIDGVNKHWINMNSMKAKRHDMLSNAHRRAAVSCIFLSSNCRLINCPI